MTKSGTRLRRAVLAAVLTLLGSAVLGTSAASATTVPTAVSGATPTAVPVTVPGAASALTLTASPALVGYGRLVLLHAHLTGATLLSVVSIYSEPPGQVPQLLATAQPDGKGNVYLSTAVVERTSFVATALPVPLATAAVQVSAGSRIGMSITSCGTYTKGVRVCRHGSAPKFGVKVDAYASKGECAYLDADYYRSGWHHLGTTGCLRIGTSTSSAKLGSAYRGTVGNYRYRASWHGDSHNAGATGRWVYLRIT